MNLMSIGEVAKGLQKTDGLETSQYLETVIADTITDKYGTAEAESNMDDWIITDDINTIKL